MPTPSFQDPFPDNAGFGEIGFPWRLFMFAVFIFGFSVFAFLGLKFGYGAYLKAEAEAVERDVEELSRQVEGGEEESLVDLYSRLVNVKDLLDAHLFPANMFSFLEQHTLPDVRYESLQFDGTTRRAVIAGFVPTPVRLAEQLSVFDGALEVQGVSLNTVRAQDFGIAFGVSLLIKKEFFEKVQ